MVTLLITTRNRADLLRHSLRRLCHLTLPEQVLVIDDGGTDETPSVCAEFAADLTLDYVYHDNPGTTICSQARNVGVRLARGDLIVTSEPELKFQSDVIAQFLALREEHPGKVISSGRVDFLDQNGKVNNTAHKWVAPHTAIYEKAWIAEVGGWDESFPGSWGWDDTDLLTRLRIMGHGQHIAEEVHAIHQFHPLGSDGQSVNERHFLAKGFHDNFHPDAPDVIANEGIEWGKLRTPNN